MQLVCVCALVGLISEEAGRYSINALIVSVELPQRRLISAGAGHLSRIPVLFVVATSPVFHSSIPLAASCLLDVPVRKRVPLAQDLYTATVTSASMSGGTLEKAFDIAF